MDKCIRDEISVAEISIGRWLPEVAYIITRQMQSGSMKEGQK